MNPEEEAVRALAYRLWEQRGKLDGLAEQDWFEAERQLRPQAERRAEGNVSDHAKVSREASTEGRVDTSLDMGSPRSRKNRRRNGAAADSGASEPS